jgi:hypothetical protein
MQSASGGKGIQKEEKRKKMDYKEEVERGERGG